MKKEVLLIFKTHLDIGFTDYSEKVCERYLSDFIPNAIRVGYELKGSDTPFVWTVGSWMLWQALKNDKDGIVERAIKDGILRWHGLPFTTHTEIMNKTLFEYGVNISDMLDERFGMNTISAKMTDVPGHTVGMIPILKSHGIEFLHLGVNPATPVPSVPAIFRWKRGDDEITVMYQGDYGEDMEFEDFIVSFAHTGDNLGPQSSDAIIKIYEKLRKKYPDHYVRAATIDDLAIRVRSLCDLPVVEGEIGDSWIHGVATDPQKISRYRRLLRLIEGMENIPVDLTDSLLCVPEHTWGMDVKTHFPYNEPYSHRELEAFSKERAKIEASWQEQREYVSRAEELLGLESEYPVKPYDLSLYTEVSLPAELGYEISWQLFDNSDYDWYRNNYMRCHLDWAIRDFTKVGLKDYKGGIYNAKVTQAYEKDGERLYLLEFDSEIADKYGLPQFYLKECGSDVEIKWFGKKASRYPQAFWFKIKGLRETWQINKMGEWISPDEIIDSPLICAVDKGVRNGDVTVECLDSALVAPYGRQLLRYGRDSRLQDMYFNLYNNIWNTNFPIWYSDDAIFRFKIIK